MGAPSSAVIRERDVPAYLGLSKRTYNKVKQQPGFPAGRDLAGTGKVIVRVRAELDVWLAGYPPAVRQGEPPQLEAGRRARRDSVPAAEPEREAAATT